MCFQFSEWCLTRQVYGLVKLWDYSVSIVGRDKRLLNHSQRTNISRMEGQRKNSQATQRTETWNTLLAF